MQRTHCDVCDKEIKRDRGHIWSNTLPAGHRLREVSALFAFYRPGRGEASREQPIDVCEDCMLEWLRGIRGVTPVEVPAETK